MLCECCVCVLYLLKSLHLLLRLLIETTTRLFECACILCVYVRKFVVNARVGACTRRLTWV